MLSPLSHPPHSPTRYSPPLLSLLLGSSQLSELSHWSLVVGSILSCCFSYSGILKDLSLALCLLVAFFSYSGLLSDVLLGPDSWLACDGLVTPALVLPEWYLLSWFGVLKCVPSKSGGLVAVVSLLLIGSFSGLVVSSSSSSAALSSPVLSACLHGSPTGAMGSTLLSLVSSHAWFTCHCLLAFSGSSSSTSLWLSLCCLLTVSVLVLLAF